MTALERHYTDTARLCAPTNVLAADRAAWLIANVERWYADNCDFETFAADNIAIWQTVEAEGTAECVLEMVKPKPGPLFYAALTDSTLDCLACEIDGPETCELHGVTP